MAAGEGCRSAWAGCGTGLAAALGLAVHFALAAFLRALGAAFGAGTSSSSDDDWLSVLEGLLSQQGLHVAPMAHDNVPPQWYQVLAQLHAIRNLVPQVLVGHCVMHLTEDNGQCGLQVLTQQRWQQGVATQNVQPFHGLCVHLIVWSTPQEAHQTDHRAPSLSQ